MQEFQFNKIDLSAIEGRLLCAAIAMLWQDGRKQDPDGIVLELGKLSEKMHAELPSIPPKTNPTSLQQEMTQLFNRHGVDAQEGVPDYILTKIACESIQVYVDAKGMENRRKNENKPVEYRPQAGYSAFPPRM